MKKLVKVLGSIALIGSFILSLTGCAITDVKNTSDELMDSVFDMKSKKVCKFLNEDDDYDMNEAIVDAFFDDCDTMKFSFTNIKPSKTNIHIENKMATIDLVYPIKNGGDYDYQLVLEKDGDDWVVSDNEEFIVNTVNLFLEIYYDIGSDDQVEIIETIMENYDVNKPGKIGQKYYNWAEDNVDY